ncbi:P1 family peptidase [Enterococcus asini]|uniref:P1 family peptidase n=1 Tax=Enterococcus asini TaxID=57732 RepID=A0AAW8U176_9ENTE|nr:P1 family peptidase [Enterococcus asini]MDT2810519.1 P1 family peptidase [Enterococcus asini]
MGERLQEINISEIAGVTFGQVQDYTAMTGVSVALFSGENTGGIDVSGGGPASREAHLLSPYTDTKSLNALVFAGGSAYGLGAADGVMKYLEERNRGFAVPGGVVPLVVQSDIFDLTLGDGRVRPDAKMAYEACLVAEAGEEPVSGSVGAGTGAAVGKLYGMGQSQKAGIAFHAAQLGELQVGVMVVVNAFGDVFDWESGKQIRGLLDSKRQNLLSTEAELYKQMITLQTGTNTTLAAIFTNAQFNEGEMNKIAAMARSGLARSISPVNTMADGDTIYAFSLGEVKADLNIVGVLAARVLSEGIKKAVTQEDFSEEAYRNLVLAH